MVSARHARHRQAAKVGISSMVDIIEAKGFDADDAALRKAIGEQALALMRSFRKRGTVEQIGLGRGMRWKLPNR